MVFVWSSHHIASVAIVQDEDQPAQPDPEELMRSAAKRVVPKLVQLETSLAQSAQLIKQLNLVSGWTVLTRHMSFPLHTAKVDLFTYPTAQLVQGVCAPSLTRNPIIKRLAAGMQLSSRSMPSGIFALT